MNRVTAALLVVVLASMALADQLADAKKGFADSYRKMDNAFAKADFGTIEPFFASTCIIKRAGEPGNLPAARFFQISKGMSKFRRVLSSSTKLTAVKQTADGFSASISWTWVTTGSPEAKSATKDANKPQKAVQSLTDSWRKIDGKWLIVKRVIGD
jgi:hypothetical protein